MSQNIVERLIGPPEWRRSDPDLGFVTDNTPKEAAMIISQLRAEINALQAIYEVHLDLMKNLRKEGHEI